MLESSETQGTEERDFNICRQEIDHLLSDIVDSRTHSGRILRYLADAHFAGHEEALKEYSIAVDALGRSADFDPKVDSIVRVEIHKLRRQLREYYGSRGEDRAVAVSISPGGYRLSFISRATSATNKGCVQADESKRNEGSTDVPKDSPSSTGKPEWAESRSPGRWVSRWGFAALFAILAFAAIALWQVMGTLAESSASEDSKIAPSANMAKDGTAEPARAGGTAESLRISAGAVEAYTDRNGRVWSADMFHEGGRTARVSDSTIQFTRAPEIFLTRREGDFRYHIPVGPGIYDVRLFFAETQYGDLKHAGGGEASRMFRITINDQVAIDPIDVVSDSGGADIALARVFPGVQPGDDGKIHLRFESLVNEKAFVNAIEVLKGLPDRSPPLRMTVGSHSVEDRNGFKWEAEDHYLGGRIRDRSTPVAGGPSPALFRAERFGNFRYRLPATPGHTYTLTVWAAEQFFTLAANPPRAKTRHFDILANGNLLARDVDLLREAGGAQKAVHRTFRNLRGSAQGYVELHFRPISNYALVNAIEFIDEGPAN